MAMALVEELQRVNSKLKQLKQRAKDRQRKSRQHPRGLTPYMERLVAAVFVLSNYDATVAAQQLLAFKKPKEMGVTLQEAQRLAEDMFAELPDDFAATVSMPDDVAIERLAHAAKRFIAGHGTRQWVEQQNRVQGLAPGATAARQQYERLLQGSGVSCQSALPARSTRQWASPWRKRWWGVKRGRLCRQGLTDPDAIVAKAACIDLSMVLHSRKEPRKREIKQNI